MCDILDYNDIPKYFVNNEMLKLFIDGARYDAYIEFTYSKGIILDVYT